MKYFLVAFSLLILAGCGGLLIPSNKDVTIKSVPDEATVSINGINSATTPVVVRLDNKSSHVITVSKSGYDSVSCALNTTVQEYIVALDIIGGLIPVIIDALTGNWKALDKNDCMVWLPRQSSQNPQ